MKTNKIIQVLYDGRLVGTLALTSTHKAAFEYSEEWMETGFPVSPFSLPLKRQVFLPPKDYFDATDSWRLSPAYDLTYSNTYYGEHTTTVDGNGRNPGLKELVAVGTAAGLKDDLCKMVASEIDVCAKEMLGTYVL